MTSADKAVTTNMQVELTYKAEPTLTMTCITRVKSAEVCKEVDDDSGIEFGEVDLRICLQAILIASPELKKEEWSVYVLDQTVSERKFSGNGTINSVIKDEEPVPVVGKVKKKFRRETLEIELRLVKVPISPAKKQSGISLEHLLPYAFQQHSMQQQSFPRPSSPPLPPPSSPTLPTRRLLAPILQQHTPPASSFPPFTDQMWTDFDIPLQNQDFSNIFTDQPEMQLPWQYPDPQSFETLRTQSVDTPMPAQTPFTAQTPFAAPIQAPIPPPPVPGPPTPQEAAKQPRKRSSTTKEPKHKRPKKQRKETEKEVVMPSSPPLRAFKQFAAEDLEMFLQSEATSPAKPLEPYDFGGSSWEDFLVQSESEQTNVTTTEQPATTEVVPHVAFTAVNSTVDSSMEFSARQILLNAEFTPASSPDQTRSPSAPTESDSASPTGLTPFGDTPAPTQDIPAPSQAASSVQSAPMDRKVLSDVTNVSSSTESNSSLAPVKEKRPRGRPKGWRKSSNRDGPPDIVLLNSVMSMTEPHLQEKQQRKRKSTGSGKEDQWSVRIQASIKDAMLKRLAKGELPPMCFCCGDIQPTSWRHVIVNEKQERFCNACGLFYKKHGVLKQVPTSPPRRPPPRRPKSKTDKEPTTPAERETPSEPALCPSSPPQRTYEPMSEIDHPLLSEGICLPRMGYLRGDQVFESGDDDEEGKENVEPEVENDDAEEDDDDDEMERFFSDVLAETM